MHELGHNLGLHHGGPATAKIGRTTADYKMNCKPNYLSVMNYARQMPWDLAGTTGSIDSTDLANWEGQRLTSGDLNYRQDATKFSTMLDYAGTAQLRNRMKEVLVRQLGLHLWMVKNIMPFTKRQTWEK